MDIFGTHITACPGETQELGREIGNYIKVQSFNAKIKNEQTSKSATILALSGNLGVGKTTLIQGIAQGLGYNGRIVSPTFIIMKRYNIPEPFSFFYHIDCYRMDEKGMIDIGLFEVLRDPYAVVCVEWAEKIPKLIPENSLHIDCSVSNEAHVYIICSYE